MINTYYLLIEGEKTGPYTQYELMDMDLDASTLILSPLADDWQELRHLPEFTYYLENKGIYLPVRANLATFWWRLIAYIIDYVLILLGISIIGILFFTVAGIFGYSYNEEDVGGPDKEFVYNLILIGIFIIYNATCEASKLQGSIGKVACKLLVVDADGKRLSYFNALGRNAGKILSSLILGMGFLRIIWDDSRQGWHDELAKAYIIRRQ